MLSGDSTVTKSEPIDSEGDGVSRLGGTPLDEVLCVV